MKSGHVRNADGFVLIGVVMLVLALTILGLSLFSLSSYESQFLGDSIDELQAFHLASGALERAKYVLSVNDDLGDVKLQLPPNVDSLVAIQYQSGLPKEDGQLEWDGGAAKVFIRARASFHGATRIMQAWYTPARGDDYYRRLITVSDRLTLPVEGGIPNNQYVDRRPRTALYGGVWLGQQGADTLWTDRGPLAHRPSPIRPGGVPRPNIDAFINDHWSSASSAPSPVGFPATWFLGQPGTVTYYKSSDHSIYGLSIPTTARIRVFGTVVWMFKPGFRAYELVEIVGSKNDHLIMVGKSHQDPSYPTPIGVWFHGSVRSDSVRLILCSDEEVRIEHANTDVTGSVVDYLSVYAHNAWIMGPIPTSTTPLSVNHPTTEPDLVIDYLNDLGVLPSQSSTTRNRLTMVPGTWSESHPTP